MLELKQRRLYAESVERKMLSKKEMEWIKQNREIRKRREKRQRDGDAQRERNKFLYVDILGNEFIFDRIGLKLFNEEFKTSSFKIVIDDGYLARQNLLHPDWPPQYFHRWLKFKRTSKKNQETKGIHVHHKNGNVQDNRIRNLVFKNEYEHHEIHKTKKAYKTFCQKFYEDNPDADPQLCSWSWSKFKEKNGI